MPLEAPDLLRLLGLFAVSYIAYGVATSAWAVAFPGASSPFVLLPARISWWAICAVLIVNPIAEEFVYLGFIANVLRRRGGLAAIVAAVAARMAVHIYQGPLPVVGVAASCLGSRR